jgi:hypothetical protein
LPTTSASYNGVINIGFGTGAGVTDGAYGELNLNVNFGANTLSGSATNFAHYDQSSASGSMLITNGALTGNNTGIGDGLTADASGTVSGNALNFDVTGHFAGNNAEAVYLYLDAKSAADTSLGVGIAVKP